MRFIFTGGGTGGHVFPGIAVAEALKSLAPDAEILFVGGAHGLEATAVPEAGFAFRAIPARGLLGKRILAIPSVLWTLLRGITASYGILRRFDPDVVFATGGYVSGAVALAGRLLGRPLVLHEQNSVPGMTNRVLSRTAAEVHLNMPGARRHFPRRDRLRLSGNPIRRSVLEGDRDRGLREYELDASRTTVLVVGGSQGARSINRAAADAISLLSSRDDLQFVLQTGRRDYELVRGRLGRRREWVRVRAFIANMGDVYRAADLVVARAGAMTLAEIAVNGRAAILVPFPHATHDHQEANARVLVEAGAATVIPDRELGGDRLASEIAKIVDTPRKLREMSGSALRMARPDAAERIARALIRCAGGETEVNGRGENGKT